MTFDPVLLDRIATVFAEAAMQDLESRLHTQTSRSDAQARREESNVGNCRKYCDSPISKGD